MTLRTLGATLLLLIPLFLLLPQCKQRDTTPPVPKVMNTPTASDHGPNEKASQQAPSSN